MEVSGGRQPRHQRDVLDGVPAPVAAPTEHVVGPPHAKQQTRRLQAPRQEGEPPCVRDPRRVDAPGEKRGARKAERDREGCKPREDDGRMDQHPAVAQDRIQAEAVGRRHGQQIERAGHDRKDEKEEGEDRGQDARGVGRDPASQSGAGDKRGAAQQAEDHGPVEQRSFLASIERGRDERDRRG